LLKESGAAFRRAAKLFVPQLRYRELHLLDLEQAGFGFGLKRQNHCMSRFQIRRKRITALRHTAMESHSCGGAIRDAQTSHNDAALTGCLWPEGVLRRAPVNPFQKITQLRRRNRRCFTHCRRPDEAPPLKTFGEQTQTLPVVPQQFDETAAFAAKDEDVSGVGFCFRTSWTLSDRPSKPLRMSV